MTVINGTSGNDYLTGTSGDDEIRGLEGDDILNGGAGADHLIGGAGTDTASYAGSFAVTLNLKTGVHTGTAAGDTFAGIERFQGSNFGDVFVSGAEAVHIDGNAGIDTVDYSASSVGVSVDLDGRIGSGGDAEGDTYYGLETVVGSAYSDTLRSSLKNTTLAGGTGDDVYVTTKNHSFAAISEASGAGDDEIQTSFGSYSMAGFANVERLTFTGVGNAWLTGNSGDNVITAGAGNDTLIGGAGADHLIGGAGTDTASYAGSFGITLNLKTGVHTGDAAGDTFDGIERYQGSNFGDVFVSGAEAVHIDGNAGIDTVDYSASGVGVSVDLDGRTGSGGDAEGDTYYGLETVVGSAYSDTLRSSLKNTTLAGGTGDDVYVTTKNHSFAAISEASGAGDDEIQTSFGSYSMAGFANVERLTFTGVGNAWLTGNSGDNVITAGAGNDTLIGGAGADHLIGGGGTDTASYAGSLGITLNLKTGVHTGDAAGDTFDGIERFQGSSNADTFYASAAADYITGGGGLDSINYSLSQSAVDVDLTARSGSGGDAEGDTLYGIWHVVGSDHDDILRSNWNNTTLEGGQGNDVYVTAKSHTYATISEDAGEGDDEIQTSFGSYSMAGFANVERLTYTGAGSANLTGNSNDNVITAGSGNDTLNGGDGADRLIGGEGTDTVSYAGSFGVTVDLKSGVHAGAAAGDTFQSIERFLGSTYNDVFIGGSGTDYINGNGGLDTVDYSGSSSAVDVDLNMRSGSGGDADGDTLFGIERVVGTAHDDTLRSNLANTTLAGGAGNDVYVTAQAHSYAAISELAGEGDDEIETTFAGYSMAGFANVERLTYSGTANAYLTGNAGDNIITGGSGNDTLTGGAGADHLIGGDGTDTASYADSSVAMTFDLAAGVISGIGGGDTFSGIEWISGTNFSDTFVASANADLIQGGGGIDRMSYAASTAAISIDLSTNTHTGLAAGDSLGHVEIIEGSAFADSFIGDTGSNIFVGGAGADVFDGGAGTDSVWYIGGATGVSIDLANGIAQGGDASGDTLISIENLVGSAHSDTLNGDGTSNRLEGGGGGDILYGQGGNDVLYGDIGSDISAMNPPASGGQADKIFGGGGDDTIYSATIDKAGTVLSEMYGETGNDTIFVNYSAAFGGDNDDTLYGLGEGFILHGEAGNDLMYLQGVAGQADGGEGSDSYHVEASGFSYISETGSTGIDKLHIEFDDAGSGYVSGRSGDHAILSTAADISDGTYDTAVILWNWYAGQANIEHFYNPHGAELFFNF